MEDRNLGTYSLNISNSNQYFADLYDWLDLSEPEKKSKKKKKKKKKHQKRKKARKKAKKMKKATQKLKKKKTQKKTKKRKKRAEKQYAKEFKYQLLIKATDTACDITRMYFYSKFGSPA